jgi:hypothetical protein
VTSEQDDVLILVKFRKQQGNDVVAHDDVAEAALPFQRSDLVRIQLVPIEACRYDNVARPERELPDDGKLGGNDRKPPPRSIGEWHRHVA